MTSADSRERGLDPAHILGVTNQAVRQRGQVSLAVATSDGIRICLRSRRAASDAHAALTRVGYQVVRGDSTSRRDLLVTGWSAAGLEARLAAMRAVLYQLHDSPNATAGAVIERFRSLPPGSPARRDGSLLAEADTQLLASVTRRSGIHMPHDPAFQPADLGIALRLRAARTLENAIDDLIERHLRVAAHALRLFQSLRLHTTEDQARETALRRASVFHHLSTSPEQDPSAQTRRPGFPPGPDLRPPESSPDGGLAATVASQAASSFPGWPFARAGRRSPLSQPGRAESPEPSAGPTCEAAPGSGRPPSTQKARKYQR